MRVLVTKYVLRLVLLAVYVPLFLFATPSLSQVDVTDYKLTAVYVYKLLFYIKAPDGVDKVKLCTLGEDRVNDVLASIVDDKNVNFIKNVSKDDVKNCNVLYVSPYSNADESYIEKLSEMPIVTISDIRGFVNKGGVVAIEWLAGGKVKLKINNKVVKKHNFKISPDLLSISEVVQ